MGGVEKEASAALLRCPETKLAVAGKARGIKAEWVKPETSTR